MGVGLFCIIAGVVFTPFIPILGVPLVIIGLIWLVLSAVGGTADSLGQGIKGIVERDEEKNAGKPPKQHSQKYEKTFALVMLGLVAAGILAATFLN